MSDKRTYITSQELRQVRDLFEAALRRDPEERAEFLDHACTGKPWLRVEVTALFAGQLHAEDAAEAPPFETTDPRLVNRGPGLEGRSIGSYIIRQEIGRGGMGVVYLADDTRLSRRVALKAIAPGLSRELGSRERLRREARAAATLSHPGIATVFALEEIGEELYLACEYVPGLSLRAVLASGPLPLAQAVEIGTQLARAMAAAHVQGIIHRDLKPENVVRTPAGAVKILDFGLAWVEGSTSTHLTQTGVVVGTPAYMAPEQARGQTVDFRSDLFSFGLVVYEMVSGANPFATGTVTGTIARILEFQPARLSGVQLDCVPDLAQIVATCLRKDPAERYKRTEDLVADLARVEAALHASRPWSPAAGSPVGARSARSLTPRWWWGFHQAVVSGFYSMMIIAAWQVRSWLLQPWDMLFMFAVLVCAASATILRLHLLFTAHFDAAELPAEHSRSLMWRRWGDGGFAALLVGAALGIGRAHPEVAILLVAVATVTLVAAFVIEPATTRAAFRESSGFIAAPDNR